MKSEDYLVWLPTSQDFQKTCQPWSEPIRALLKNNTAFIWEENEKKAFGKIKTLILNAPLLRYFNVAEQVEVQVDASSSGLGACLMQGGQPIQYVSRALTDTEKRYSQIEKEMLSIVFGLTRFHTHTYGRKVTVYTVYNLLKITLLDFSECCVESWNMMSNSNM